MESEIHLENKYIKLHYGKSYNGNAPISNFKGYEIRWSDSDKPMNAPNFEMAATKAYKSHKKWGNILNEILTQWNDNTTFNDICKIVGPGNYKSFYLDYN